MNNYSKQLNKETLPEIVKSHSDHYQIYFMTIKFNRPYIKPDQPQLNRQDYDEYFNYFYRRLNKKSLYKSNQPNKTILFAFPEKSHFVISDKTEKQVSMPNHYHCVVLIPNQHDNRFRKRCIVSNNKELRYEISENLYDPYPMKYQYNQTYDNASQ